MGRHICTTYILFLVLISIHTPAKGATSKTVTLLKGSTFLFTPPRRGRPSSRMRSTTMSQISIHAPAKGATPTERSRKVIWYYFYSRPREGGDILSVLIRQVLLHFYSRPREGGDCSISAGEGNCLLFLFTPPRRGRPALRTAFSVCIKFLFTPPRRGRRFH